MERKETSNTSMKDSLDTQVKEFYEKNKLIFYKYISKC